jgi:hypothetical protein
MEALIDAGTELYELAIRDAAASPIASRQGGITARDLTVLMAVATKGRAPWGAAELARELGLSALDVGMGLERARRVGLLNAEKHRVLKEPVLEFLVHGLRYVFPAEVGAMGRGIATAQLAGRYVWPARDGDASGRALAPLDAEAARAAQPALRELLGLVDVLRVGLVWERSLAVRELARRLDASL